MAAARALRLGWLFGFKNVETMTLDDLKDAIAGRGMSVNGEEPIALDTLLPSPTENETQWMIAARRREALNDEGLAVHPFWQHPDAGTRARDNRQIRTPRRLF